MNVTMQGPEGESIEANGIWLAIEHGRALSFTDAYEVGFIPKPDSFMTGAARFEDDGDGATRMIWTARHRTEDETQKHLEMGFEKGWTAASRQLSDLAVEVAAQPGGAMLHASKARTCFFLKDRIEEAARLYVSLCEGGEITAVHKPDPAGPAMVVEFTLAGAPFMLLAGNPEPVSTTLASVSILTQDQAETDRLWSALLDGGGEAGPCGWIKDRFGAHWQIVPEALPRLMHSGDPAAGGRVQKALMAMKKIDIGALEAAHAGG